MKKAILIAVIAILGIASAQAQEFKVIDKKPIDSKAGVKIQMSFEKISRMQRDYFVQMKKEDVLNDSIYFKDEIDKLFGNLWNVHALFESEMSVPDTITVVKYLNKFYENGDTTQVDLITERQQILARYNILVAKYGELTEYEKDFQLMKKRFLQLQDWENQITSQ